jgi:hypothetical protein
VAKGERKKSSHKKPQRYDTSFKKWISQPVHEILPVLVTGVKYERELSAEVISSAMRADKVFQVQYHDKPYVLHIEFESGADDQLPSRLLVYNAALYHEHHLPVMSIMIYLFSVKTAVSPLVIPNSEKDLLTFHFETLPLFNMDAESYVQKHTTCMYPLLPTMRGFHAEMATQALNELSELYQGNENTLAEQFIWMQLFLERNKTIQPLEKAKIKERFHILSWR